MISSRMLLVSILCAIVGMVYFAWQHEWIIIRYPWNNFQTTYELIQPLDVKKRINLMYWYKGEWHQEIKELLCTGQKIKDIQHLITSWLNVIEDEAIITKKIVVQSVVLSFSGHEVYISFDRNLLPKEMSIFGKWMLIEGLLKTLRENNITVQRIHLLVQHQPIQDAHLDFSNPWPIAGFIQNNQM